ncbi:MAG: hypothetical protein ACRDUY_02765 [Nitriliruptorales bacterium]
MTTRHREPLPHDTTVVVRGGVMHIDDLRRNALITLRRHGFAGISVFAAVDTTLDELLAGPVYIPHAQIRTTTVGRLRDAAFELRRTLTLPYHYDIVLEDTDDDTLARLLGCFDEPQPNPHPRRPPA